MGSVSAFLRHGLAEFGPETTNARSALYLALKKEDYQLNEHKHLHDSLAWRYPYLLVWETLVDALQLGISNAFFYCSYKLFPLIEV